MFDIENQQKNQEEVQQRNYIEIIYDVLEIIVIITSFILIMFTVFTHHVLYSLIALILMWLYRIIDDLVTNFKLKIYYDSKCIVLYQLLISSIIDIIVMFTRSYNEFKICQIYVSVLIIFYILLQNKSYIIDQYSIQLVTNIMSLYLN